MNHDEVPFANILIYGKDFAKASPSRLRNYQGLLICMGWDAGCSMKAPVQKSYYGISHGFINMLGPPEADGSFREVRDD